jgi:uncharacterized protein
MMTTFGDYRVPPARYKGTITHSAYVTMRDGVKIAVEVTLPGNLGPGDRIPALLSQTRYWRAIELNTPFSWFLRPDLLNGSYRDYAPFFTGQGYALVSADVRGTGASLGTWQTPWDAQSVIDAGEIVDWLAAQPWCNGKIAGVGVSYVGTTAELLAATQRPAVKAVLPMFNHPDAFIDIAFPGGIFNQRFISAWASMDQQLDRNIVPGEFAGWLGKLIVRGVKPVDGERRLLQEAIVEHAANGEAFQHALAVVTRDQVHPKIGIALDDLAVHTYAQDIATSGISRAGWGSWMDAGTADAALRRFMTFDNVEWTVIGAWDHGGRMNASPYAAPHAGVNPSLPVQWREQLRFHDAYLKDADNGVRGQKTLWYYTLGEETWKTAHSFPLPGTDMQRWFFARERSLSQQSPLAGDGADTFSVDFAASTGLRNRWWELSAATMQTIRYNDRAQAAQHMLTYLTPPLAEDTEITGYPVVTLFVTSSASDGAFYVYLEDVAPDGHVTYVTDGQLRAIHRRVSTATPPYQRPAPYHSFRSGDVLPLVPGEIAELSFGLLPTSVLIRKGHRIRIGLAGHDDGTFVRIPATGTPVITLAHNAQYASHIDLPVVLRPGR